MSMQNEWAFLKTILKRKDKSFIGAQVRRADGDTQSSQRSQSSGEGLTLGIHTAYQKKKKKDKQGTGPGGGGGGGFAEKKLGKKKNTKNLKNFNKIREKKTN